MECETATKNSMERADVMQVIIEKYGICNRNDVHLQNDRNDVHYRLKARMESRSGIIVQP